MGITKQIYEKTLRELYNLGYKINITDREKFEKIINDMENIENKLVNLHSAQLQLYKIAKLYNCPLKHPHYITEISFEDIENLSTEQGAQKYILKHMKDIHSCILNSNKSLNVKFKDLFTLYLPTLLQKGNEFINSLQPQPQRHTYVGD